jgi:hypothetical protein
MGEQAVVAHADAERAGHPPEHDGDGNRAPVDEKQGRDRADVEGGHGDSGNPVGLAVGSLAAVDFGNGNHDVPDSIRSPKRLL